MRQKQPLTNIESIKRQLSNSLKASADEHADSMDVNKPGDERMMLFQQACEKLYKAMIHVLELKSGYEIQSHGDIFDEFYWQKAGYQITIMSDFLAKMNLLHNYFYEGPIYPARGVDSAYSSLNGFVRREVKTI